MSIALGIDTSNYTSSAALFDSANGLLVQAKKLLPVKEGQLGLRQSDAVFHHARQLPDMICEIYSQHKEKPERIGVSVRPRPVEGSYMPCFELGKGTAKQLGAVLDVPVFEYSHQEGHIAAALYSCGLLGKLERFYALHLSGGTTELLLCETKASGFNVDYCCGSLDLKAGQLIDRTALKLGLKFPGGAALDKLAFEYDCDDAARPTIKGLDCCLSGIENKCEKLIAEGEDAGYVAAYCINSVSDSVSAMINAAMNKHGEFPVLFAGGVSSSKCMRNRLSGRWDSFFADAALSADNAVGIAALASMENI